MLHTSKSMVWCLVGSPSSERRYTRACEVSRAERGGRGTALRSKAALADAGEEESPGKEREEWYAPSSTVPRRCARVNPGVEDIWEREREVRLGVHRTPPALLVLAERACAI